MIRPSLGADLLALYQSIRNKLWRWSCLMKGGTLISWSPPKRGSAPRPSLPDSRGAFFWARVAPLPSRHKNSQGERASGTPGKLPQLVDCPRPAAIVGGGIFFARWNSAAPVLLIAWRALTKLREASQQALAECTSRLGHDTN
jgi:hypothetical protein